MNYNKIFLSVAFTCISLVAAAEDCLVVHLSGGKKDNEERLQLKGSTAYVRTTGNEPVKCYTVDGIELPVRKKNEGNGVVSVDLSEIDQPVVILTVGEESIKIRMK